MALLVAGSAATPFLPAPEVPSLDVAREWPAEGEGRTANETVGVGGRPCSSAAFRAFRGPMDSLEGNAIPRDSTHRHETQTGQ